jgi:hypothetical protein
MVPPSAAATSPQSPSPFRHSEPEFSFALLLFSQPSRRELIGESIVSTLIPLADDLQKLGDKVHVKSRDASEL